MNSTRPWLALSAVWLVAELAFSPQPTIAYSLRIDPDHLDVVDVAIRLDNAPNTLRLAMKVHPEYDAKYWRYLDSARVEGSANDSQSRRRPGRQHALARDPARRAWHRALSHSHPAGPRSRAARLAPLPATVRRIDQQSGFFLYLPDFANAPVTLGLDVPAEVAHRDGPRGPMARRLDSWRPMPQHCSMPRSSSAICANGSSAIAGRRFMSCTGRSRTPRRSTPRRSWTSCVASWPVRWMSSAAHHHPASSSSSRTAPTTRWNIARR